MPVLNRIADLADDMRAWRHHLHAHPELLFDVHRTAAFVVERLRAIGVDEIHEGIGRTGVVALVRGGGAGPVIGLRADMDALPIEEAQPRPYRSTVPGKMHACGHDGHTAMLLGAAAYLAETRNFAGAVALIFQPAEEGGGGGREMLEDGMIERFGIDRVFGLHNWPGLAVGRIDMAPGPVMASSDGFRVTFCGRGSHAAFPERSADPVLAASAAVVALQGILGRTVSALDHAVLSVTQISAGTAYNVVPEKATIAGTARALDERVRQHLAERFRQVVEGVAAAHGVAAEIAYEFGYPVTVNDPAEIAFAAEVAGDVVGPENVRTDAPPTMGAEDFSYMLQARPGAYVLIGQGDTAALHHPDYDFNDEIAPIGASYLARLVERAQPAR